MISPFSSTMYSSNNLKMYVNKAKRLANTIETKMYVDL